MIAFMWDIIYLISNLTTIALHVLLIVIAYKYIVKRRWPRIESDKPKYFNIIDELYDKLDIVEKIATSDRKYFDWAVDDLYDKLGIPNKERAGRSK